MSKKYKKIRISVFCISGGSPCNTPVFLQLAEKVLHILYRSRCRLLYASLLVLWVRSFYGPHNLCHSFLISTDVSVKCNLGCDII